MEESNWQHSVGFISNTTCEELTAWRLGSTLSPMFDLLLCDYLYLYLADYLYLYLAKLVVNKRTLKKHFEIARTVVSICLDAPPCLPTVSDQRTQNNDKATESFHMHATAQQ